MIVGTAEVTIVANDSAFATQLREETAAPLEGLAADATVAGDEAGAALSGGIGSGLDDAAKDAEGKTSAIGETLLSGATVGGTNAGAGLRKGISTGLDDAAKDTEAASKDIGSKLTSGLGSSLGSLSGLFGNLGADLGPLGQSVDAVGGKLGSTNNEAKGFLGSLTSLGGGIALGATAGLAVFSAASVKMASDFDSTVTSIAANAKISTDAAKSIGDAFLSTGGQVIFSAQEQAGAYAGVAGQLGTLNHGALDAKQALDFMKVSMDLAEGSGTSLGTATSTLSKTLQVFQLGLGQATNASNILFSTARAMGTGIDSVSAQFNKLRGQLGAASPSLGDLGGLMLDLANHGEATSQAMRKVTTSLAGLLTPSADVQKAQELVGVSFQDSKGNLDSLSQIMNQVQPIIAGMGSAQATATLKALGFGSASGVLVSTLQSGSGTLSQYTKQVQETGTAHEAAEKQSKTLSHQFDLLKTAVEDAAVKWGNVLIPVLEKVAQEFLKVGDYILDHKAILISLGVIVGTVLVAALTAFAVSLAAAAIEATIAAAPIILLVATLAGLVYGIVWVATNWQRTWQNIKNWTDDAIKFLRSGFGTLVVLITGPIAPILELALHWQAVWATIKSVTSSVVNTLKHDWDTITSDVTGSWDKTISFFKSIPSKILDALDSLGSMLSGWMSDAFRLLENATESAINAWLDIYVRLPDRVLNDVESLASRLVNWIGQVFDQLLAGAEAKFVEVDAWWMSIPGRILSALGNLLGLLAQAGHDLIQGLFDGATTLWTTAGTFFGSIKSAVGGFFEGIYTDMLNIGKRVIQGIEDGITNEVGNLWSTLKGVASKIGSFLSDPLKILSPSRVMMEQGKYIIQGLSQGIATAANTDLQPALNGVVSQVNNSFNPRSLGSEIQGTGGGIGPRSRGTGAGQTVTVIVNVASGAVTISGLDPTSSTGASDAVNDAFTTMAREIGAGIAPLRQS